MQLPVDQATACLELPPLANCGRLGNWLEQALHGLEPANGDIGGSSLFHAVNEGRRFELRPEFAKLRMQIKGAATA